MAELYSRMNDSFEYHPMHELSMHCIKLLWLISVLSKIQVRNHVVCLDDVRTLDSAPGGGNLGFDHDVTIPLIADTANLASFLRIPFVGGNTFVLFFWHPVVDKIGECPEAFMIGHVKIDKAGLAFHFAAAEAVEFGRRSGNVKDARVDYGRHVMRSIRCEFDTTRRTVALMKQTAIQESFERAGVVEADCRS